MVSDGKGKRTISKPKLDSKSKRAKKSTSKKKSLLARRSAPLTANADSHLSEETPTLRVRADAFRKPRAINPMQSETPAIRKRLDSLEDNFRLLDEQLDLLEQKIETDVSLTQSDSAQPDQPEIGSEVHPRKPR